MQYHKNCLYLIFQDEHIKNVTKEFCDWVSSLGGESNNIEESTITSLFASGYETKPALSVPIHVVELTNVPPELRRSAAPPEKQEEGRSLPSAEEKKQEWVGLCPLKTALIYCAFKKINSDILLLM